MLETPEAQKGAEAAAALAMSAAGMMGVIPPRVAGVGDFVKFVEGADVSTIVLVTKVHQGGCVAQRAGLDGAGDGQEVLIQSSQMVAVECNLEGNYDKEVEQQFESLVCACCSQVASARTALSCTHVFCTACLVKWKASECAFTCPYCRVPIKEDV